MVFSYCIAGSFLFHPPSFSLSGPFSHGQIELPAKLLDYFWNSAPPIHTHPCTSLPSKVTHAPLYLRARSPSRSHSRAGCLVLAFAIAFVFALSLFRPFFLSFSFCQAVWRHLRVHNSFEGWREWFVACPGCRAGGPGGGCHFDFLQKVRRLTRHGMPAVWCADTQCSTDNFSRVCSYI